MDAVALRRVAFLVGVGSEDRDAADVPRQWDRYLGADRVTCAQSFVREFITFGVRAHLEVFQSVGHRLTDAMRARALEFIAAAV